ncbi:MAG: 3',5'-cyclic-nucleotide phosphodiesterase [Gammaproteobacteria bacterium]|jgi:ribonuclease BN (tRNA processing enzyme)
MKIRILGCSGGVGQGLRTTSLLVDEDILIDAGSGVGDLTLDEMAAVRHIFLTHSHLDHVAFIPLMLDSIFEERAEPLIIHAQPPTLEALQRHIFNWVIWPDFARLPSSDKPALHYETMTPGQVLDMSGGRSFEMIPVEHAVPAVGYRVACPTGVFAFSGDTSTNDSFWAALNAHERLDLLIVETAFRNADVAISRLAKHYCPSLLAEDLHKLRHRPDIYITHNKPGEEDIIIAECRDALGDHKVLRLISGEVLTL